jgi:hypothetical protein
MESVILSVCGNKMLFEIQKEDLIKLLEEVFEEGAVSFSDMKEELAEKLAREFMEKHEARATAPPPLVFTPLAAPAAPPPPPMWQTPPGITIDPGSIPSEITVTPTYIGEPIQVTWSNSVDPPLAPVPTPNPEYEQQIRNAFERQTRDAVARISAANAEYWRQNLPADTIVAYDHEGYAITASEAAGGFGTPPQ